MTEDSNILSIRGDTNHTDRKIDDLSEKVGTNAFREINTATQGFAGINTALIEQAGGIGGSINALRCDLLHQHYAQMAAIHAESEKTRDLITEGKIQDLRDRAEKAERENALMHQSDYLLDKLGVYWPKPPYIPA